MHKISLTFILSVLLFHNASTTFAVERNILVPPTDFQVFDTPNDNGKSISLRWPASPSDSAGAEYVVYMSTDESGPFDIEALRIKSNTMYEHNIDPKFHYVEINLDKVSGWKPIDHGKNINYFFKLALMTVNNSVVTQRIASTSPKGNWFNWSKLNNFLIMIIFSAIVLYFINHAKKKPSLFIRKISGLDAMDEAIGRATEMGKPALFVHGLNPMGHISTIAAVNILGRIARKVAEYDTPIKVSNVDPIVLSVSQEVVKESYLEAGRPDAYVQDNVFLAASEQFPYVVAVSGLMIREKTAANFFMGYFYAESLILAETGAATGAIQIAATDAYTQLPFFITTCDYTLMGEELYAASAYLSREPLLLGSLRAQDVGKGILIIALLVGVILTAFGIGFISNIFSPG